MVSVRGEAKPQLKWPLKPIQSLDVKDVWDNWVSLPAIRPSKLEKSCFVSSGPLRITNYSVLQKQSESPNESKI